MRPRALYALAVVTALVLARGCGGAGVVGALSAPDPAADTIPLAERRGIPGTIVFVSERDGNAEVYAVGPAGGAPRRLTADPAQDFPGAVSPDGRTLAVVSVREGAGAHRERLALLPLAGGRARPLGAPGGRVRSPSWSASGRWLAFESDAAGFRDVFRVAADGSGMRRLSRSPQGSFEPEVSPDGRRIAFAGSRGGDAEVYVMAADGSGERRLTAFHRDDWGPRWAPDGRTLAFLSDREGTDRVFLVGADGTGVRRLAAGSGGGHEAYPAWSPDGRRVAYTGRRGEGGWRVLVAEVATGAVREVRGAEQASQPAWSPDGRHLAFMADAEGDAEIWIARADGSGATRLTRSPGPDWLPRWAGPLSSPGRRPPSSAAARRRAGPG